MDTVADFVKLSQTVGKNKAYVQGAGGNTSIKLSATEMVVKASGICLKELTSQEGFVVLNYPNIRDYSQEKPESDTEFSKHIKAQVLSPGERRPSMEAGFHAILGPCVLHTHAIYCNVLTCAIEGWESLPILFPEAILVPYKTPGRELTLQIQDQIGQLDLHKTQVFFLQNHGIIVSGSSSEDVLEAHERIIEKINAQLDLPLLRESEVAEKGLKSNGILFPDQAVLNQPELSHTQAAIETQLAYTYISTQIQRLNWTPNYLSLKIAEGLQAMPSEQYRQGLAK